MLHYVLDDPRIRSAKAQAGLLALFAHSMKLYNSVDQESAI